MFVDLGCRIPWPSALVFFVLGPAQKFSTRCPKQGLGFRVQGLGFSV